MRASTWTIRRARELKPLEVALLAETFFLLLATRIGLRYLPIRHVIAWQSRPLVPSKPRGYSIGECQLVRWAVLVVARHAPIRFVCFPQCLAASALLRRRGIPSRLHYGVTRNGEKLETHTWLEACGEILIGGEVAREFSTLAVYGETAGA